MKTSDIKGGIDLNLLNSTETAQIYELAKDIEKNGQKTPIKIDTFGGIVKGYRRLAALQLLNREEAIVLVPDNEFVHQLQEENRALRKEIKYLKAELSEAFADINILRAYGSY